MKGKLLFVAGVAAGYVVGARAGRQAYDSIKVKVQTARENPQVQNVVAKAKDLAEQKVPKLAGVVTGAAVTASSVGEAVAESAGSETSAGTTTEKPETAEEAAQVFIEQEGDADESTPTATA
jgi:hypothetical protein